MQSIVRDWFFATWEACQRDFDTQPPPGGITYDEMIGYAEMAVDGLSKPDEETQGALLSSAAGLLKKHGRSAPEKADVEKLASYIRRGWASSTGRSWSTTGTGSSTIQ